MPQGYPVYHYPFPPLPYPYTEQGGGAGVVGLVFDPQTVLSEVLRSNF